MTNQTVPAGLVGAVFDAAADEVLAVAGTPGELWGLQVPSGTWTRMADLPLAATVSSSVAWDPSSRTLFVLVADDGVLAYSAASATWSVLHAPSDGTATTVGEALVFDPDVDQLVRFGGCPTSGCQGSALTTQWFDIATDQWSSASVVGDVPPQSQHLVGVWAPLHHRVLVYVGRSDGQAAPLSAPGLWSFELPNARFRFYAVSLAAPGEPVPALAAGMAGAFDLLHDEFFVFGGSDCCTTTPTAQLWAFRDLEFSWAHLPPEAVNPAARAGAVAVWDTNAARMLVLGGTQPSGSPPDSDVWAFTPDAPLVAPNAFDLTATTSSAALSWLIVPGANHYVLLRNGTPILQTTATHASDPFPPNTGVRCYRLEAVGALEVTFSSQLCVQPRAAAGATIANAIAVSSWPKPPVRSSSTVNTLVLSPTDTQVDYWQIVFKSALGNETYLVVPKFDYQTSLTAFGSSTWIQADACVQVRGLRSGLVVGMTPMYCGRGIDLEL